MGSLLIVVALAATGLGVAAYRQNQALLATETQLATANRELGRLRLAGEVNLSEAATLEQHLAQEKGRAEELRLEKERAERSQRDLEREMRQALESKEVTISRLKGKLTVNILDRVLFDSGRAELRAEGKEVLQRIADVLKRMKSGRILVVGHTDNEPIRASRHLYDSNWELANARATAAVRFLCEQAGVKPERIAAAGCGEFRPVADNATPEGRARNRRIEVLILAEDILGRGDAPER